MNDRETLLPPLTRDQERALKVITTYGMSGELTLWLEGLNSPRNTLRALERKGLVKRGEYLNEDDGYLWTLA